MSYISHRVEESNATIRNRQSDVRDDSRFAASFLQLLYRFLCRLGTA